MRIIKVITIIAVLCLSGSVFADTLYNVNLWRLITEYSGPGAIGEAGDYWNFISANMAQSATKQWALNDSAGNTSSLVMDTTNVTRTGWSSTDSQTNAILRDYWSCADTSQSLVFTGLDNSKTYDFYIFSDTTSNNNKPSITIGTETLQASSTTWYTTFILNTNYVLFEDIAPTNGSITVSFLGPSNGSPVNGIQILEVVPEPATMLLLGSGGLFALIRKRNRL